MKYRTYTQMEGILRTAFDVEGNSIKDVAEMAGINRNTLYKWNCGAMRFSTDNIDILIVYYDMSIYASNINVATCKETCSGLCNL